MATTVSILLKGSTTADTSTLHSHLRGLNCSLSCLDMAPSETVHGFAVVSAVLSQISSDASTSCGSGQAVERGPSGMKHSAYRNTLMQLLLLSEESAQPTNCAEVGPSVRPHFLGLGTSMS